MYRENLLSIQDAAEILDVSCDTMKEWIEKGHVTAIRIGGDVWFDRAAVRALFDREHLGRSRQKKRILFIDDDVLVGQSIKHVLEVAGFEVSVVPLGLAALDCIAREHYDLVLTDIRMPGMNGIETLKAIRSLRKQFGKPSIPDAVLTAYDDEDVRREAERMGINDVILKPFDLEEFLSVIKRNLGAGHRRKAYRPRSSRSAVES